MTVLGRRQRELFSYISRRRTAKSTTYEWYGEKTPFRSYSSVLAVFTRRVAKVRGSIFLSVYLDIQAETRL